MHCALYIIFCWQKKCNYVPSTPFSFFILFHPPNLSPLTEISVSPYTVSWSPPFSSTVLLTLRTHSHLLLPTSILHSLHTFTLYLTPFQGPRGRPCSVQTCTGVFFKNIGPLLLLSWVAATVQLLCCFPGSAHHQLRIALLFFLP